MKTWRMRDLPGLLDSFNGAAYALDLAVGEKARDRVASAVRVLETVLGCMRECIEDDRDEGGGR